MASNSRWKSTMKSPILVTAVSMYFFAYVFFSIDIPLKIARATRIWGPKSQRCHICTAVSMTLLCMSQRFNDTSVHITAESMTLLCMSYRCQWLHCACHIGVNDSAVHVTSVSLTPLCRVPCAYSLIKTGSFMKIFDKVGCTVVSMTPLCMSQQC
jgi:hypothetical protein